jgi:single-strand DNA-binding protein
MNIVVLKGNLATDVRLRTTTTGKEVASFKLAVNRPGKDAGADFIWVKVWNGSAVACNQYLQKGSPVLVDGSIRTSRVGEGADIKEYVEVNARQVTFLSTGNGGNGASSDEPPTDDEPVEFIAGPHNVDSDPVAEAEAALAKAKADAEAASSAAQSTVTATVVEDDDIPF